MRVLHDMLGNWQTFWHFNWLKDEFNMITTVGTLQLSLRAKLQSAFEKLLEECVNCDVIETNGFRYTYGPNWTDFVGGHLKFSERMFLAGLHCHMVEAGEDLPQIEDALERMFEEHELEASLADLSKMGVIERHETTVTRGPNFGVDNGPWLRYRFLNDFVADAACAAPVRGGQCDSCKRRPFDSQDESYVMMLHTVDSRDIRHR